MIGEQAKDWIVDHFQEVLRIKTTSQSIATGFAVGTFVSVLPEPGFAVLIAALIVLIFKKISKIAIFVSMAIWNPVALIPLYVASYWVGDRLLASQPLIEFNMTVLNRVYYFTDRFLLGNLVVAFVAAGICHVLVFAICEIWKKRKARKAK